MAASTILTSFASGELSSTLFARVDLDKYHSGVAKGRNFFVDYRGGMTNRAGTKFIGACAALTNVRLIPFIFSRDQSYVLEFTVNLIRVFLRGVLVTTVATPYTAADLFRLRYTQSADVLTLVHPDYPPYNLNRTSPTAFALVKLVFSAGVSAPSNPTCTPTVASAVQSYAYAVTAIDKDGHESLSSQPSEVGSAILDPTATTPVTIGLEWNAIAEAKFYNIFKAGPFAAGDAMPTVLGYIGQAKIPYFTDNNIAPDFAHCPPEHRDPFSPGQVTSVDVTAAGSGMTDDFEPVVISGDGTGAVAYVAAKGSTNAAAGAVVVNGGINYTSATAAPTSGSATFAVNLDLNNRYPGCVTYFQQRRCFAGSTYAPDLVEMSKTGDYGNFDVSPSVLDSDAITVNIASREVNTIQHMVPMSTGLVIFTKGNAFLLTGGGNSGAVSPSNVSATPQASTGAGDLQPILVNYNILFNQYEGTVVRDMTFQWQTSSYYGVDRTTLASHLFTGFALTDWSFALEPYHLLCAVRDDGKMLVMAYVPEQEVYGWTPWDTRGFFRSVCCVPEGDVTAIYVVVERRVGGVIYSYLERFMPTDCCIYEAWYLDSAVSSDAISSTPDFTLIPSGVTGDITFTVV